MLDRYGVKHALQNKEFSEKAKSTWKAKYGVTKLSDINSEQKKQTNLARYNAEYPLQSTAVQAKVIETNKLIHGYTRPFKSKAVQEKAGQTIFEKYGVKSVLETPDNRKKAASAILEKYGVSSTFALTEVKKKSKDSILEKYGVEHISHRHLNPQLLAEFKDDKKFSEVYNLKTRVSEVMEYFGISRSAVHHRAKDLNLAVKHTAVSEAEQEIANFLKQYTVVEQSNRLVIAPKEIDIWLPEFNLGIEYNGIYHHSSKFKVHRNYHIDKTVAVEAAGGQLIHIFSDEWLDNREIVESRLLNKIGKSRNILYARKCKIVEVSSADAATFLARSHIQGNCFSSKNYALSYNDKIVALMTFGTARFTKLAKWELLRFCTAPYTTVVGGASKLLKHFRKSHPGTIVSYADRRWSNGNLYRVLGFEFAHYSGPGYSYVKNGCRYSRNKFQKHKLSEQLEIYDKRLSETQNMEINGFYKLYDCGNSVWYLN
jgi:hypothetical protein